MCKIYRCNIYRFGYMSKPKPDKPDSGKLPIESVRETFKFVRNNGIFAFEVPTTPGHSKILGKFNRADLSQEFFDAKCNNSGYNTIRTIIENTTFYYPKLDDKSNKFVLYNLKLNEICKNIIDFLQFAQKTETDYVNSTADKNDFISQFDLLPLILTMSDEEAAEYVRNLENISFDDWIPNLPDSLHIENYQLKIHSWKQINPYFIPDDTQIPTIDSQTNIFNSLLSHFLTIELLTAIKDDIVENTEIIVDIDATSITADAEFKDIEQLLKEHPRYRTVYDAYYMLKCMCFILHDKPVHDLAPFLLKHFERRMFNTNNINNTDITNLIKELIHIYKTEFNINGVTAQVSQLRCHRTLDELTKCFKNQFPQYPEMIKVYSVPYAAFKIEKNSSADTDEDEELEEQTNILKELKQYLLPFTYGLGDAVGTKTFITQLDKKSIYPNTLSLQDAAGSTYDKNGIKVEETIDDEKKSCYFISENDDSQSTKILIEPLNFLDVEIRCLKIIIEGSLFNFFLYYALGFDTIDDNNCYSNIIVLIPFKTPKTLNVAAFLKPYLMLNDKKLIGVITSKVSQNDTIPLINDYLNIEKSKRGKRGKIHVNHYIWWVYKDSNSETDVQMNAKIILGTIAKEAGDQSKIQVVGNLSRNGKPSYVATVDSFFSHSLTQGGVLFKGGNIEVFIPQGFQSLNKEQKISIMKILQKINIYKFETIKNKIQVFLNKVSEIIKTILNNGNLGLSDTTILIFNAILKEFSNIEYFITENRYNLLYNNGQCDVTKNSGIFDELSFLRRLVNFDRVSKLFSLLDDELQNRFYIQFGNIKIKIKDGIIRMVDTYLLNTFDSEELSDDNTELIIPNIKLYFEQFPLLFLMSNITIINTKIFYRSRDGTSSATTKRHSKTDAPFINNILKEILISKLYVFCQTYNIQDFYFYYIEKYNILPNKQKIEEIAFEDDLVDIIEEEPYEQVEMDVGLPVAKMADLPVAKMTEADLPVAKRLRSSIINKKNNGGKQKRKTRKLKSNTRKKRTHRAKSQGVTKRAFKRHPSTSRKARKSKK